MKCEFSETQFVFGIMNELVTNSYLPGKAWAAPFFPTQRQEDKLGYDVSICGPVRTIYFQFKVPEKKVRANGKYWNDFNGPYYQFKIWPDSISHQHNILVDLANKNPHNKVYYCSPAFHTNREFNKYYKEKKISKKSIYVPCKPLAKITGSDEHDVSYIIEPQRIYKMHSDEYDIEGLNCEEMIEGIRDIKPYKNLEQCLNRIVEYFEIQDEEIEEEQSKLQSIANYLWRKHNLQLMLIEA